MKTHRLLALSVATASACAFLASCASSVPLRFYTLSEVAPSGGTSTGSANVRVGRVRVPAELDRSEIVQRIDANRLQISELDRWAAPLSDMTRRVLNSDLELRGASVVASAPAVSVEIEEFVGDASCAVTLKASWQFPEPVYKEGTSPPMPPASGRDTIHVAGGGGACTVGALPGVMSQALAQLSEKILATPH